MKVNRRIARLLCVIANLLAIATTCSHPVLAEKIIDTAGRTVEVPLDPARILCLGPGSLRLIIYLEAQRKVVGVEDMEKLTPVGRPYWMAHKELWTLPGCGPGGPAGTNKKPDMERVLNLRPEVIFVAYMDGSLADEVQRLLRIPIVVLSYGSFATFDETVYKSILLAGKILNKEKRARELIAFVEGLKSDLKERTESIPRGLRPKAYVGGIGFRGAHGIESSERQYIPFEWVNAINIANELEGVSDTHVFVDREALLRIDPDVVFVDGGGVQLIKHDHSRKPHFYRALRAFSTGRVHLLHPYNFYTTNICTALTDAYAVGKVLYPDRFSHIIPREQADKIYTFMVGKPVYSEMEKEYGGLGEPASFFK